MRTAQKKKKRWRIFWEREFKAKFKKVLAPGEFDAY